MIVDTSALVAIVKGETGDDHLLAAVLTEPGLLPTPVLVEFDRVTALPGNVRNADAWVIVNEALRHQICVVPFDEASARAAVDANVRYGRGSGHPAKLNMLDLMVYGVAKALDMPILCTGKDFSGTDVKVHPASRVDG